MNSDDSNILESELSLLKIFVLNFELNYPLSTVCIHVLIVMTLTMGHFPSLTHLSLAHITKDILNSFHKC